MFDLERPISGKLQFVFSINRKLIIKNRGNINDKNMDDYRNFKWIW
ncbi:hypothetical protein CPR19088_GLDEOEPO_00840 [Companilactobacillus paralimentarius]